jgi:hypothetical protein
VSRLHRAVRRSLVLTSLALLVAAVPATAAGNGDKGSGAKGKAKAKSALKDRNHDRIPDRWERRHGLSLKLNQAKRDQDHDGVRNRSEYLARTDPRDADTDEDGVRDGEEGAGRIARFAGGKLTVTLFNGDDVTARVDGDTSIECHASEDLEREAAKDDDHEGRGSRARAASEEDSEGEDSRESGSEDELDDEAGELEDEESDERYGDPFGDEDEHACADGELKAGRIVHEGELRATPAGLAWRELKLVL